MDDDPHRQQTATIHLSKRILRFYERGLKFFPLGIMLTHWYGIFDYHTHPRDIIIFAEENEYCVMFLYMMTYIFPLVSMLPASYFFHLCWIWRIPFVYLTGVSIARFYFRTWLITEEMIHVDYFLVFATTALYIYAFIHLSCARQYPAHIIRQLLHRRQTAG